MPQYAALANGVAAYALDFDDTVLTAMLHPSASIVSAAAALGEWLDSGGKELLTAIVAGYDVAVRIAEAINSPPAMPHHRKGFHPTSTCGVFGATAAACKLLGLSKTEVINALGIAGSLSSGLLEFFHNGMMTKRFHPGKAAHDGILAALLAQRGYTGPASVFEGRDGLFRAYSDDVNPARAITDLGRRYTVLESSLTQLSPIRSGGVRARRLRLHFL